ncbi:MAG: 4-hydroxy-tetrahydrodipicolinate reductase [Kiritimatiellae bacterium]|nr:4-hydroxy-tetrahydrodipicolinate reductase [Kiritimatiellia bacterium]
MKIAILGAAGRMGQMLIHCGAKLEECECVAAVERPDFPQLGQPVYEPLLSGSPLTYTAAWPEQAECIIDFTFHACVPDHIREAAARGQAYVLGTTGLSDSEQQVVIDAAKTIPVVWANNMSTGVNLLLELVRRSAEILGPEYDIEIVETHHRMKKDAPSGTALSLAKAAADGRKVSLNDVACYGREGIVGERPVGQIGIHALRGGSVVGDHTVAFMADEERIELTHKASSRESFAKGALRAALWLKGKAPGLYSMRHVLGFE